MRAVLVLSLRRPRPCPAGCGLYVCRLPSAQWTSSSSHSLRHCTFNHATAPPSEKQRLDAECFADSACDCASHVVTSGALAHALMHALDFARRRAGGGSDRLVVVVVILAGVCRASYYPRRLRTSAVRPRAVHGHLSAPVVTEHLAGPYARLQPASCTYPPDRPMPVRLVLVPIPVKPRQVTVKRKG